MKKTTNGRFCGACQHEVIDLTKMSLFDIHQLKKENDKLCGQLNYDQIENDEQAIEFNFFKKSFALASTLFVLQTTDATAQNSEAAKTEQTSVKSCSKNDSLSSEKKSAQQNIEQRDLGNSAAYKRKRRYIHLFSVGEYNVRIVKYFPYLSIGRKRSRGMIAF